jgi:hypothetical protein
MGDCHSFYLHVEHIMLTINRMMTPRIDVINAIFSTYLGLLARNMESLQRNLQTHLSVMITIFILSAEHYLFYVSKV